MAASAFVLRLAAEDNASPAMRQLGESAADAKQRIELLPV